MRISDWSSDVCSSDLILDVAKIEAGAHELRDEEVDPYDVVGAVVRLVAERAKRAELHLTIDLPEGLPRLTAAERKPNQVLLNLMSHPTKFTPAPQGVG